MSEAWAIELANLSKTYGRGKRRVEAVKEVALTVSPGQVYGFLGPNGAGKTTTIRMIMDLVRPSSGQIYLFGKHARTESAVLNQQVGAMVEHPTFYNYLTGRKNLEVLARTNHCYNPSRVAALLAMVRLTDAAGRLVKGYSTGMKQRLGLAAALLNDPDLVVLDEPTNGLDPAGIQEMRGFIRDLVDKEGKTVFLSSHLLGEVEQICDRVAIINQGRIVREGNVRELLSAQAQLKIEAQPLEKAAEVLSQKWPVQMKGRWLTVQVTPVENPSVVRHLVAYDIELFQLQTIQQSLEEYFLSVTGREEGS